MVNCDLIILTIKINFKNQRIALFWCLTLGDIIQRNLKNEKVNLKKRNKKKQIVDKLGRFLRNFVLTPCCYILLNLRTLIFFYKRRENPQNISGDFSK